MIRNALVLAVLALAAFKAIHGDLQIPSFRTEVRHEAFAGRATRAITRLAVYDELLSIDDTGTVAAGAPSDPALTSLDSVLAHIDRAKTVTVSAYTLSSSSRLYRHLRLAAARGARVGVVLTRAGMASAVADNERFQADNPALHVVLSPRPLHLKSAVIDGGAGGVYLSDRNWSSGRSLIAQLPQRYALTIERAAAGDPHDNADLTTTKASSLQREATMLRGARQTIDLESESFGEANPVYDALNAAAQRGVRVRLLVAASELQGSAAERSALAELTQHGVQVGTSADNQKLAVVDGKTAWFGSSNATSGVEQQIDWGFTTSRRELVQQIERAFAGDVRV